MKGISIRQLTGAVSGILALSAASAWAANPTIWTTDLIAVSNSTPDAHWTSPTPIDLGFPEYQYTYQITQADADFAVVSWQSVLSEIGDTTGNGSFNAIPISLQNQAVDETLAGSTIQGTISMSIDSSGYGHLDLTGFSFSGLVSGARAAATITITGVPEPTTFGLLALTGPLLLSRRRRKATGC